MAIDLKNVLANVTKECPPGSSCDPFNSPYGVIYNTANIEGDIVFTLRNVLLGVFSSREIGNIYTLMFDGNNLILEVGKSHHEQIRVDVSSAPQEFFKIVKKHYQGILVHLDKLDGDGFDLTVQLHPVVT